MQKKEEESSGVPRVLRTAVASRLFVLALICVWRSLFPPYDTSASLNPPCLSSPQPPLPLHPPLLPRLGCAVERSVVWDAVYLVRIAECGYEYEQTYAFFPFLPISMWLIARTVFAPLVPVIGYRAVLALSGYVLNNVAFVTAAVFFYRLSILILNDKGAAMRASILFCFNPASIFYSSIYSESLFALFTFGGLYYFFSGSTTVATVLLTLSGSVRSNGMLNAGYFCFQALHKACGVIIRKNKLSLVVQGILTGIVQSICIILPFISFQAYGFFNMCSKRAMDELRPWCKTKPPRVYDYIQGHYWGVGFMRYFQVKQLPNFLLASPILCVAVCSIVAYSKIRPGIVFSLGLQASPEENILMVKHSPHGTRTEPDANSDLKTTITSKSRRAFSTLKKRRDEPKSLDFSESNSQESIVQTHRGYSSILLLPFIYHLAFLALTAFFVMHVQVATRFLSASPPVYWYAAYLFASSDRRSSYLIWSYSSAYILLGSLLFSNFYPFT